MATSQTKTTFICDCNLFQFQTICQCACVFGIQAVTRLRQIFHLFDISSQISIVDLVQCNNYNEDDDGDDGGSGSGGCGDGDDIPFVRLQHHCERESS